MKNKVWGINVIGSQGVNVDDDFIIGSSNDGDKVVVKVGIAEVSEDKFKELEEGELGTKVIANPGGVLEDTLQTISINGVSYGIEAGGSGNGIQQFSTAEEAEELCSAEHAGEYAEYTGESRIVVKTYENLNNTTAYEYSLNKNQFISKIQDIPGTYKIKYNGSNWILNNNIINPSEYGISIYKGTPEVLPSVGSLITIYANTSVKPTVSDIETLAAAGDFLFTTSVEGLNCILHAGYINFGDDEEPMYLYGIALKIVYSEEEGEEVAIYAINPEIPEFQDGMWVGEGVSIMSELANCGAVIEAINQDACNICKDYFSFYPFPHSPYVPESEVIKHNGDTFEFKYKKITQSKINVGDVITDIEANIYGYGDDNTQTRAAAMPKQGYDWSYIYEGSSQDEVCELMRYERIQTGGMGTNGRFLDHYAVYYYDDNEKYIIRKYISKYDETTETYKPYSYNSLDLNKSYRCNCNIFRYTMGLETVSATCVYINEDYHDFIDDYVSYTVGFKNRPYTFVNKTATLLPDYSISVNTDQLIEAIGNKADIRFTYDGTRWIGKGVNTSQFSNTDIGTSIQKYYFDVYGMAPSDLKALWPVPVWEQQKYYKILSVNTNDPSGSYANECWLVCDYDEVDQNYYASALRFDDNNDIYCLHDLINDPYDVGEKILYKFKGWQKAEFTNFATGEYTLVNYDGETYDYNTLYSFGQYVSENFNVLNNIVSKAPFQYSAIDLSEYGITVTGTPASGDSIVISLEDAGYEKYRMYTVKAVSGEYQLIPTYATQSEVAESIVEVAESIVEIEEQVEELSNKLDNKQNKLEARGGVNIATGLFSTEIEGSVYPHQTVSGIYFNKQATARELYNLVMNCIAPDGGSSGTTIEANLVRSGNNYESNAYILKCVCTNGYDWCTHYIQCVKLSDNSSYNVVSFNADNNSVSWNSNVQSNGYFATYDGHWVEALSSNRFTNYWNGRLMGLTPFANTTVISSSNIKLANAYDTSNMMTRNALYIDGVGYKIGGGSFDPNTQQISIGLGACASGNSSLAVGYCANAKKHATIAIGSYTNAYGNNTVALGSYTNAYGNNTVALGYGANAYGNNAVALGTDTNVPGNNAVALGYGANAYGNNAIALGYRAKVSGNNAVAIGYSATAAAINSISIGYGANANGNNAISMGANANSTGNAISIGANANSTDNAISIGVNADAAFSPNSVAIGMNARIADRCSNAIQLGEGFNNSANSLQFRNTPIVTNDKLHIPVYNISNSTLGQTRFVKCTQSEYDSIGTKDPYTLYIIIG